MTFFYKILRVILIVLLFFLALTAIPGGIVLATNLYAPPVESLQGTLFPNFVIPGLALAMVVGGSGLFAAILLLRQSKYALLAAWIFAGLATDLLWDGDADRGAGDGDVVHPPAVVQARAIN
jgi:hypothetical protein